MDLHAILVRAPVNRLAASVVAQRKAAPRCAPLTREELLYLVERIQRKQRLLAQILGIRNMRHKKNLKTRANAGQLTGVAAAEPRAWKEYRACGEQIHRLQTEIAAVKAARRAAYRRGEAQA